MADPIKSPAVQAYNKHKDEQRAGQNDPLDEGLEDTFPASDPVSATQSTTTTTYDPNAAVDEERYPLVEEALRSTGEIGRSGVQDRTSPFRNDASRLSDQASEIANGAVAVGKDKAKSVLQSIEDIVRERPLTAVGIVAALAWFWGATR
jgi:ElaB/YqjD/DUF883 family membrane-anchored ribosome-binding protein